MTIQEIKTREFGTRGGLTGYVQHSDPVTTWQLDGKVQAEL